MILSDQKIRANVNGTYRFLNNQLKPLISVPNCRYDELYKTSELLLSSENRLLLSLGEGEEFPINSLYDSCLYEFITKYPDEPEKSSFALYSYLQVFFCVVFH